MATELGVSLPQLTVLLDDFPQHRREALLWRHALELDYAGVEDLVAEASQISCSGWEQHADQRELIAVLADDGRYHLSSGTDLICGKRAGRRWAAARDPQQPAEFTHAQDCFWWTDGSHYRIQPPPLHRPRNSDIDSTAEPAATRHRYRIERWTIRLTNITIPAEHVPIAQRCPTRPAHTIWPSFHNPATPRGRIRIRLAAEFGLMCHACRLTPGYAVDHDHFTGLVRGLLCRNCNTNVDSCPHLAGCPWADYLNSPPALPLQLRYPRRYRPLPSGDLARVEYLGFNPFPRDR